MNKKDVLAFMTKSFDDAIAQVSKLTPEQLSKTYQSEEGSMTGLELLLAMLGSQYSPSRFRGNVLARERHHARGIPILTLRVFYGKVNATSESVATIATYCLPFLP